MIRPVSLRLQDSLRFSEEELQVVPLFSDERFHGTLVCLEPGQEAPAHHHEHKDEVFDVIEGVGMILLGDKQIFAGPGTLVFVPAGFCHGLHNNGSDRWVLRETVYERIYARAALRLTIAAMWRRVRRRSPAYLHHPQAPQG